jgi:hypothetical protein
MMEATINAIRRLAQEGDAFWKVLVMLLVLLALLQAVHTLV